MSDKQPVDRKSTKLISRRQVIQGAAGITVGLSTGLDAVAQTPTRSPAVPTSDPIKQVRVGSPTTVPDNFGDTWVAAWADDGNLYAPSNDTLCFDIPNFFTREQVKLFQSDSRFFKELTAEQKRSWQYGPIGFNRIEGDDPAKLRGVTVNRMQDYMLQDGYRAEVGGPAATANDHRSWKSSGCTFIDGTLYWVIHRDKIIQEIGSKVVRQTATDSSIIKSNDYGKTWMRPVKENYESPMFPGASFPTPYFIDYGNAKVPVHGADRYVYAISNNGFWDNGDRLFLARVPRTRIGLLNSEDWEFFAGGDGLLDTSWMRDSSDAKPILEGLGRFGETGAAYLPHRGRYMMIGWYYPGGGGYVKGMSATTVWDFYEAPTPWGPWTHIKSHRWHPQGYYCPIVCPKFQAADKVYVVTAGDFQNWWDHYHLTMVPIDLG